MKSFLNFITESEKREENLGSVDILGYPHELRISAHANEPREQPLWFGIQEYNSLIKFAERRFEKNVINVDRLKKEPRKSYNLENKRIINIVKKGLNKIFNQQSKLFKSEFQKMFEGYQEPKELNPYFTNFNLIYNPLNHGELYSMSRLQEFYKWVNETEEGKKLTEEKNGKKYNGEDVKKFIQILNSSMDKRYNAILIAIGRLNSQLGSNQNHIKDSSKWTIRIRLNFKMLLKKK